MPDDTPAPGDNVTVFLNHKYAALENVIGTSVEAEIEAARTTLVVSFTARLARLGVRRCAVCRMRRVAYAIEVLAIGSGDHWRALGEGRCAEHAGVR